MKQGGRIALTVVLSLAVYWVVGFVLMGSRVFYGVGLIVPVVLVAALLLGFWLQVRLARRATADHIRCSQCGYDLTGHAEFLKSGTAICPECGRHVAEVGVVEQGRPHPRELARTQLKLSVIGAIVATIAFALALVIFQAAGTGLTPLTVAAVFTAGLIAAWFPVAVLLVRSRIGSRRASRT